MSALHKPIDSALREELNAYDDITAALLARRGVTSAQEADTFLNPSYDAHTHDPMLMLNMPKAAGRLSRAIDEGEHIAVWSDYDADGIPGGVILHDFLKKAGASFTNYIPHRHLEGYGVNTSGIKKLSDEGVSLLITVDSGITDVEAIALAKELGMDVIVTDHHEPGEILPNAFAVVDPKQPGETYPFRELCGAGLAWKLVVATLAHGFSGRENIPEGWEKWLLDMVGFATIADMVPLMGENRVLARYGLTVLRKSPRKGIGALCSVARIRQQTLSEDDIAFSLAPRINAASRMGSGMDAFKLLTVVDEVQTQELAKKLEAANRSRRSASGAITRAVRARLEKAVVLGGAECGGVASADATPPDVIVIGDADWSPALLGLVASSIAKEFERPVFLWGKEADGSLKGSCRSEGATHVLSVMESASDTFTRFGGHAMAGAFTVRADAIVSLPEKILEAYRLCAAQPTSVPGGAGCADGLLTADDVTQTLIEDISPFSPFGEGNPKPAWLFHNTTVKTIARFGKNNEHVKLMLERNGKPLEAVAFFVTGVLRIQFEDLATPSRITLLAHVEMNTFLYRNTPRLRIISLG